MFWQAVAALTPMVCVALLFWYVMRIVFSADRREREAMARFEAAERAEGRKDGSAAGNSAAEPTQQD